MDLYDAKIDGYDLEIEHLDDSFEKAIARHEFPNTDGALLEDMGQKARTIRFRCYFWDDGADHYTYDDHIDFLNHLKSQALVELVHPMYGPLQGCIESVSVRHDDRQMHAEIDICFVENLHSDIPDVGYEDVDSAVETAAVAAHEEAMAGFEDDVREELGQEAEGILAKTLDAGHAIYGQFTSISLKARKYLVKVDKLVSTAEGTLTDIANPANGLISTINYGVNLPGRVIGSLARCAERYAVLYDSLEAAAARFLTNFSQAMTGLETTVGFPRQVRPVAAVQAAMTIANAFKADETDRNKLRQLEKTKSFDILGRYQPVEAVSILTINDLETTLAMARTTIQGAVDICRDQQALKDTARALLEHVNTIKLEREKIIQISLDNAMPLHLVCLKYGLPYNYAERIYTINRIAQPNFTAGEVSVYVR